MNKVNKITISDMKKILFSILFFTTTILSLSAQEISSVLLTMPDNIILGMDSGQKELLGSTPADTTELTLDRGTFSEIKRTAISADYISLQTSDAGTTEIKLLPLVNDSKIICVIKTVCGTVCDSQVQFFTTNWLPISQKDLLPKIDKDSFIKNDTNRNSQDFENAYKALDMNPVKYTLSATDNTLVVKYDIEGYLSKDDYKRIQPYLKEEPLVLTWDKTSYKL